MSGVGMAERLCAMALRAFGRAQFETARVQADACLELDPGHAGAWAVLAEAHLMAGREAAALACFVRLGRLTGEAEAWARCARLCLELGRWGEAEGFAARASGVSGRYLRGLARARGGDAAGALEDFVAVLAEAPDHTAAGYEAAQVHLATRDYAAGWPLFERRQELDPGFVAPEGIARWRGEPVAGRRVLVLPEGGHGDTIWAARFLPVLKARGAEVVLRRRAGLEALFAGLEGVDAVVEDGAGADLWCPVLSLPGLLGLDDPEAVPPARLTALVPEDGRFERLLGRARGRLKVGILWSGSVTYGNNRHRAARLTDFLPLAELPEVQLYSLQKGSPQAELDESGLGDLVIDADDCDFAETAALAQALDLIVMTDSALGHLAGSLGRPVWLLLDSAPFWYHAGGESSRWYPSMRFFRQARAGDWSVPVLAARAALERWIA